MVEEISGFCESNQELLSNSSDSQTRETYVEETKESYFLSVS